MKRKVGVSGNFFLKGTTWIKQVDSDYLAKIKKQEKRTFLTN